MTARRDALSFALPGLLALVAHGAALRDGFVLDDSAAIVLNDTVSGPFSLRAVFSTDYWGRDLVHNRLTEAYRPLTVLSYALDWRLGHGGPWVFHLTNVALHALLCALLARAISKRTGTLFGPCLGASLLAVHPLATDAVTAIVGRADLLSTLLGLTLLSLHTRPSRAARLAAPCVLLAGALCKESFFVALPVLAALDLGREPSERRARALRWLTYLPPLAIAFALRTRVLGLFSLARPDAQHNPLVAVGYASRALTSLATLAHALRLSLAPDGMLPDYGPAAIVPRASLDVDVVAGFVALLGMLALCLPWREQNTPARALRITAGLWLTAVAVTSTNLVALLPKPFAERWWYSALVALAALSALGFDALARRFGARRVGAYAAPVLVVFALLTGLRINAWRDTESLMLDAVLAEPRSAIAQLGLGRARLQDGYVGEAIVRCTRAARLCPGWSEALACQAEALAVIHRDVEAERAFRAMRASGQGLDGRLAFVRFLSRTRRRDEAHRELALLRAEGHWTRRGWLKITSLERQLDP